MGVMSPEETEARADAMHTQYSGLVEIEVKATTCPLPPLRTISTAMPLSLSDTAAVCTMCV